MPDNLQTDIYAYFTGQYQRLRDTEKQMLNLNQAYDDQENTADKARKKIEELDDRLNKMLGSLDKFSTGLGSLVKMLAFGGTGAATLVQSLSQGNMLGALSGALNIGMGFGDARRGLLEGSKAAGPGMWGNVLKFAANPMVMAAVAAGGAELALLGMGVSKISQQWEGAFSTYRTAAQTARLQRRGVSAGFGGFGEAAAAGLVGVEEAAATGLRYAMAGGTGDAATASRLFLQTQLKFGFSADALAQAAGDLMHWAPKGTLDDTFKQIGQAALDVGGRQFLPQFYTASGIMAKTLTYAGGETRRNLAGTEFLEFFKQAYRVGYQPNVAAQMASGALAGMSGAFQSPASLAFLSYGLGLSPFEMQFPTGQSFNTVFNALSNRKNLSSLGIRGPMQLAQVLNQVPGFQGTGNMWAKMIFPEAFNAGETTEKQKEEFRKTLETAGQHESVQRAKIEENTRQMAETLKSGGPVISALTAIDKSIHALTVGQLSWLMEKSGVGKAILGPRLVESGYGVEDLTSLGFSENEAIEAVYKGRKLGATPYKGISFGTTIGPKSFTSVGLGIPGIAVYGAKGVVDYAEMNRRINQDELEKKRKEVKEETKPTTQKETTSVITINNKFISDGTESYILTEKANNDWTGPLQLTKIWNVPLGIAAGLRGQN